VEIGTSNYFGLPSDAGIAMAVNGMPIFPVHNNNGQYSQQKCELDHCNLHVGQVRRINELALSF